MPNNTQLDPLEEVLFKSWMRANGLIKRRMEPDDVEPRDDYRGLYKATGGMLFPSQALKQGADRRIAEQDNLEAQGKEQERARKEQEHVIKQQERLTDRADKQQEHAEDRYVKLHQQLEDRMLKKQWELEDRKLKVKVAKQKAESK